MSEQNFKQYLGWGLVGTPAGRQYSNAGIDKQLNLGKTAFELQQELGGCLPSPKEGDVNPLCALIYREVNGHKILGLATYYSIYEQGQTRAGTYFGSFVESVNSTFTEETLSDVFETLSDLNRYQVKHFIDWDRKAYKTNNIANVAFDEPKTLDLIQLQALPINHTPHAPSEDLLFIHCKADESKKVVEELLKSGLYYQYRNIFFSESEHISQQIKQMKRHQMTSRELFSRERFVLPYKAEINHLHGSIQQLQKQSQDRGNEINRLNSEQDKIIGERLKEKEQEFQRKLDIAEQEKNRALAESQKMLELAGLGKTELSKFAENTAQIANKKFSDAVDAKLSSLNEKMEQVQAKADFVMSGKNRQSSPMAWIMSAISAILFFIILGIFVSGWLSSDKTISETEYKQLIESKKKFDEKKKELDSLLEDKKNIETQKNQEIQRLSQDLQKSKDYLSSLCNEKTNKSKSECK